MKCITDRPKWFIGRYAHKYFPEWKAVCRAKIHTYEPADADGPAIWTGTYDADGKDDDFDAQDIQDYVVDQKDGKSPPEG
jgi:hypothetical protein